MEDTEKTIEQLKADLDAANAALLRSGAPGPIAGEYKGYRFADGHRRVRDQKGAICDTEKLLAAAAQDDETAVGILEWLIKIKYSYFTKAAAPAAQKKK